jgi:hypothetical protein
MRCCNKTQATAGIARDELLLTEEDTGRVKRSCDTGAALFALSQQCYPRRKGLQYDTTMRNTPHQHYDQAVTLPEAVDGT